MDLPQFDIRADVVPQKRRSMYQFAEQEIYIPDGPFEGRRFSLEAQPMIRHWFYAIDSGEWRRFSLTGGSQSGKTLSGFVIPTAYHLFEIEETIILGIPDMDIAGDKWREDLLPVIQKSRYRGLVPEHGGGSRGGTVKSVKFAHGRTLKFMSGGGGDKSRAAFTARVLAITETDGMDESGSTSREADKITQMEARTNAFNNSVEYLECTASTKEGRIWTEYEGGTMAKIVLKCLYCGGLSTPERDSLVGWKDAATDAEAFKQSKFICPLCSHELCEDARHEMNAKSIIMLRGQSIENNRIIGSPVETMTFSMRYNAVNNMFMSAGKVGMAEWKASREDNEDNAEKQMHQFVWGLPYNGSVLDLSELTSDAISEMKDTRYVREQVPEDTVHITVGVDVHQKYNFWVAVAWRSRTDGHVIDYGVSEVHTTIEQGLIDLRDDVIAPGWSGLSPSQVWIDSGWFKSQLPIYNFCRSERSKRRAEGHDGWLYRPSKGFSTIQKKGVTQYKAPKKHSSSTPHIGEGLHLSFQNQHMIHLCNVNADYYKGLTQQGFLRKTITLFDSKSRREHHTFSKHMLAEVEVEKEVPGKGMVRVWEVKSRNNHYLDSFSLANASNGFIFDIKDKQERANQHGKATKNQITTPDGRAFYAGNR